MKQPLVGILMGSDSDLETMQEAVEVLKQFGVPYEVRVLSAHRTPEATAPYVRAAARLGRRVLIAAAGGAAHLAGAVAAQTVLPVIGVPIDSSPLKGLDALLSTVQMPGGVPVATVAIGKSGAKNAALLAVAILALSDRALQQHLVRYRAQMAAAVRKKDRWVRRRS
jgi:phosphoribosylaminoimidazole carboxylase PurE protein